MLDAFATNGELVIAQFTQTAFDHPTALPSPAAVQNALVATIKAMPTRLIALFLAFVLLWSGLNTIEAPSALAQASHEQQQAAADSVGLAAAHAGSVEDHHLDDMPSQAQSDPPTETPGMPPPPLKPSAQSLLMVEPHTFVSAVAGSPFLAGPLRPPCTGTLAG